jgi:riboflavin biosynthesis protein RibD
MNRISEEKDRQYMERAIELARRGVGRVSPNPAVGAVLVRDDRIVGEGFFLYEHLKHAEIYALEQAGEWARGATLYCSLEPCCFLGRTPPCTDALLEAGIARAVIAVADPHPQVRGRGIEQLKAAGIEAEVGLLGRESQQLNEAFFKFTTRGLPFVRVVTLRDSAGRGPSKTQTLTLSDTLLRTAEDCDAIVVSSTCPAVSGLLRTILDRHRHRPLIVAGADRDLQLAAEELAQLSNPDIAVLLTFSDQGADFVEDVLKRLHELRALSVLVLAQDNRKWCSVADQLTEV